MWKNWNPYAELIGMWNGAAVVENDTANPQKIKNRTIIWSKNSTPRIHPKEVQADICTPTFIATLFIIDKGRRNLSVQWQMNR